MNQNWLNSFHANYNTFTSVQILWKFTCIKRMYLTYFSENIMGWQKLEHGKYKTESPIDTNFSVQIVDYSNFDGSEKRII